MASVIGAHRRILLAALCALAGGASTAACLGGPLVGNVLAANQPVSSSDSSTTPTTTSSSAEPTPEASGAESSSTSSTVEATPQVVAQRKQKSTAGSGASSTNANRTTTKPTTTKPTTTKKSGAKTGKSAASAKKQASAANNVAASPESVADGALAAMLASSGASDEALDFYRIPLFLLPIYKAAAVQYGVPWQILAAINEVETDYGSDLSVSSAGAVGWMQFMPSTWLEYGVDALDAGYADPYNPVDAIFAAARYLRAAGAETDLRTAILAYNHSEGYVESVLLRAKLISTYPDAVIATLTGLVDARLPVNGKRLAWTVASGVLSSTSSATAISSRSSFAELSSDADASVVAVADGRIVKIGDSRRLGKYVVLRDIYGDVFTYAGLGSIAASYRPAKSAGGSTRSSAVEAASSKAPAPTQPATAGTQSPPTPGAATSLQSGLISSGLGQLSTLSSSQQRATPVQAKADAARALGKTRRRSGAQKVALRRGSVVASGTVLGRVSVPSGDRDGHLRFAVQPAGDSGTIDPGALLANWKQLQTALHPRGAKATNALLGASSSDVFLMSKAQLERAVLADPDIAMDACERRETAAGKLDRRVLAVLAFLSRSGLAPTVSATRCEEGQYDDDALDISAINGIPIAGHQGRGTITELTIRTLLTLPSGFVPHEIVSLMHYSQASNTRAAASASKAIRIEFSAAARSTAPAARAASAVASGASVLSAAQWDELMTRVAALPAPTLASEPSSAAVADPQHR
jgi:soluble lytic murein transglycosylase-like protein